MNGFFEELRAHKVYRIAVAYILAAGFIIQTGSVVFPILQMPMWLLRLVVVTLLVGFPAALIAGWVWHRTGPAGDRGWRGLRGITWRGNLIVLAILAAAISSITGLVLLPRLTRGHLEKSIAVLPFDNFTPDKENEYFADGIQDDVLTSLARIRDLKVISRSSVLRYRSQVRDVPEIARALGVSAVLEGSVRRIGNKVRVTVQLIDAAKDQHIWAENYDRDLTDVFAIQSELAREIASQLHARLSPAESARMQERPTPNNEAYRLYQQAHNIQTRPEETLDALKQAEQLYRKATELDPNFALAFARLSQLRSWVYYLLEPTPERLSQAAAAAGEAMRLQPALPEAHLALGYLYYYGHRDYDRAMAEFETARADLPNDPGIFRAVASIKRRQGKWREAVGDYEQAVSLSPGDPDLIENLALTYEAMRDYAAAAKTFDRAVSLVPKSFEANSLRARIEIEAKGDLQPMKQLLATVSPEADSFGMVTLARFNVNFFERNFTEAVAVLARSPLDNLHGETSTPLPKSFLAAQAYRLLPDLAQARSSYEQALPIAQKAIAESPNDSARYAMLGLIEAGLGRKDEAIRTGQHALDLLPETKDALDGPILVVSMARIDAITGDLQKAIELLEHSLATPAGVTVGELRLDPTWDVLRNEPGFQALLQQGGF